MDNLQFIQRLYNGKNCYSDSMTSEQINLLHVPSGVEEIIKKMVSEKRIVFLTGNPGDGKTFIIKALYPDSNDIYIETDLNSISDRQLSVVMERINDCYENNKPCIIAANEFPFYKLMNNFRVEYPKIYEELSGVKKNVLFFGCPTIELKRICIVDLNERNLLDKDRCVVKSILDRFTKLLKPYCASNNILHHNVKALTHPLVQQQLLDIFSYISLSGEHFVIRDILGAISYMMVSCTDSDNEGTGYYYDALFAGNNDLMKYSSHFDPILLSAPTWDEKLWNGEITEGWQFDCPTRWPIEITNGSGSVEEATQLFKSIKRKFYFENIFSKELADLQPQDFKECISVFVKINEDPKRIKRMIISSMNKLFLSADEEKDKLRVWTSHSFDLSRSPSAAVSTRYIDCDALELTYPTPAPWLNEMEFTPAYIVLRSIKHPDVRLEIGTDLLRSLIMIRYGYPVALLSSQYEQVVSQFILSLCAAGDSRDYSDGEIILANRKEGTHKTMRINNNKYYFGEGEDF